MAKSNLAVRNANILTMNPDQPRAEALAIRDGHLAAIGDWDDVAGHAQDMPVLNLQGKTVLPGMIDTHTHFLWTAMSLAALDVSGGVDHESLQAVIRPAVAETPAGKLIFGMGFTEYALDTQRFGPIIEALDAVAPDHPVFLIGVTGHTYAANSRALASLDLPEGTAGVMLDTQGRPNGLLAGQAGYSAADHFSGIFGGGDKAAAMVAQAIGKAHSVGLTTVHALEGGVVGEDGQVVEFLEALPELPLRILLWYQTMDVEQVKALGLPRIGGCILLDGDVGPHTAALREPYLDQPDSCGTLYHSQEEIDAFVLKAHQAGLQIAMHAVGDAAVEQALNAYEAALAAEPRDDHRHRIEHCEVIGEDQIERAQRLGLALAIQPPFNHFWPHTMYYPVLGEERAWKADPVRTLLQPGLLVAGGSDSTVTPLGPLLGVHAAVNHSNPAERVSVQEALELYTINAARIAFEEEEKGSLEVGKLGDLAVLAADPFQVAPEEIKDIALEMTVLDGQIVYQR
jgi:predicted amidohydrolase YtcJ